MKKLDYCIGTYNVQDVKGDNITYIHANLYFIDGKYEVDYVRMSTSGGVLSTCWDVDSYTLEFDTLKDVYSYYGRDCFRPVVSRLKTMPHDDVVLKGIE